MSRPPHLEYERTEPRKASGLRWVRYLLVISIISVLFAIVTRPKRSPHFANLTKCASNLRQIGQGISLYATANRGIFPPDLQTLASSQPLLSLTTVVCPASNDNPPQTPSAIGTPGCCSYIYVGASLTSDADPNRVVALEDPANHQGANGGNALFADGHVEFVGKDIVQILLNELGAGRNPPVTDRSTVLPDGADTDYQKNWKPRMPQLKTGVWRIPTTLPAMPE